jgi:hypothetical protein
VEAAVIGVALSLEKNATLVEVNEETTVKRQGDK